MQILFSGIVCQDAAQERLNIREAGYPVPEEFARANCMRNTLGREPARGAFLLLRSDLDRVDLNGLHTATFVDEPGTGPLRSNVRPDVTGPARTLTAGGLVITNALNLTPSGSDHPAACYLVEVADRRWLARNPYFCVPINKQFNIRAPGWGGAYYDDSRNGSSDWTWATMAEHLWGLMSTQLGSWPGLPFTPDGTPEDWQWIGGSAWDALCDVLDRIGCAVRWDAVAPATAQYDIVRIGASDAATVSALYSLEQAQDETLDREFREPVRGKVPYGVRVFFRKVWSTYGTEETTPKTSSQWATQTVYSEDVVGPDAASAEPGIYTPIWDDLPALVDPTGTVTNVAALATRAQERADDYYRALRDAGARLHRQFAGLADLQPGPMLKVTCWRQDQEAGPDNGRLLTEAVRHPPRKRTGEGKGPTATRPPDLAPTWPVYPHVSQVVRVDNGTASGQVFDSYVQRCDSATAPTWTNRERVWGIDLNGATSLPTERYLARLVQYTSSRPVYALDRGSAGLSVEEADGAPSYTGIFGFVFDQADGLRLSQPAPGVVRVDIAPATQTTLGVIYRVDQSSIGLTRWYGAHQFSGDVRIMDEDPYSPDLVGARLSAGANAADASTSGAFALTSYGSLGGSDGVAAQLHGGRDITGVAALTWRAGDPSSAHTFNYATFQITRVSGYESSRFIVDGVEGITDTIPPGVSIYTAGGIVVGYDGYEGSGSGGEGPVEGLLIEAVDCVDMPDPATGALTQLTSDLWIGTVEIGGETFFVRIKRVPGTTDWEGTIYQGSDVLWSETATSVSEDPFEWTATGSADGATFGLDCNSFTVTFAEP